jgi:hypothetical protein
MSTPLKLRAVDEDDLAVLGTCLQDALVPVHDMCFIGAERRFVMVANRFRWEGLKPAARRGEGPEAKTADEPEGAYERVHCGITIEHVARVQTRGFTPGSETDAGRLLEVLTILPEEGALTLVFAGGAAVRLEVERIEVFVEDVDEPWPTLWRPHHPFDEGPVDEGPVDEGVDRGGGTR